MKQAELLYNKKISGKKQMNKRSERMKKLIAVFVFTMMIAALGMVSFAEGQDENVKVNEALKSFMLSKNSKLTAQEADNVMKSIENASNTYGVEKDLITAIIWKESNFDLLLTYNRCIGPMQIHTNTGKRAGLSLEDLYNSDKNISFGTQYLANHIKNYGDVGKALSAYNQGSTRVNSGNYSKKYQESVLSRQAQIKEYIQSHIANSQS